MPGHAMPMEVMMIRAVRHLFPAILLLIATHLAHGQAAGASPPQPPAPPGAAASPGAAAPAFDVDAAVAAYLAKMPAAEKARSDAYFEGGYWLILWDTLATIGAMWLLLRLRWSARMRDLAGRITRRRALQTALYWVQFVILASALTFPLTVYEGFFREHQYGLSNQGFGAWLGDQLLGMAVALVLGTILIVPLFGLVRRLGARWWIWGAALMIAFSGFVSLIAPVYIAPLFNHYQTLSDPAIREPILSMARANGIPAAEVYEFDASRQSNRVSANVSGFAGTMRISLNDNLLKRCTLPEIETTMGHEIGHYVLNHAYKGLIIFGIVNVAGFALLNWGIGLALARWGGAWQVHGVSDVAVLPVAVIVLSAYFFLMTPVINSVTRTMEYEADMYGLNAARRPDAEANVDLMLGEYRKLDPGPIEEFLFFDHPSGRTRITAAMRWKAEHPESASAQEWARPLGR